MKTKLIKTSILTATLVLLIVAGTATQAGAQRREQVTAGENRDQTTKKEEKSRPQERNFHKGDSKPVNEKANKVSQGRDGNGIISHREENSYSVRERDGKKGIYHPGNEWNRQERPEWGREAGAGFHREMDIRNDRNYSWRRHQGISFLHLPRRAAWITIDGENYAFYRGSFYLPGPFGFYMVTPPLYLRDLPDGCVSAMIDNHPAWTIQGIFFIETPFGFKIII